MARTKQTARPSILSKSAMKRLMRAVKEESKASVKRRREVVAEMAAEKMTPLRKNSSSSDSPTAVESESEPLAATSSAKKPRRKVGSRGAGAGAETQTQTNKILSALGGGPDDADSMLLLRAVTASALWSRYYEHGTIEDLEEAISFDRESLGLSSVRRSNVDDENKNESDSSATAFAEAQANLGVALLDLFGRTHREETLAEALELLEQAVAGLSAPPSSKSDAQAPQHPALARAMVNLGTAYRTHAELHPDSKALDLAISMHEDALTMLTPAAHPEWDTEVRQNSLARSLMARGGEKDVERAMDLMMLRRRSLGEGEVKEGGGEMYKFKVIYTYGYDADVGLPVPDLSNLVKRLTNFPSGCGGFADIFMGEWSKTRRLKQKVAIKVLRQYGFSTEDISINDRVNKMLRAEIRIWHALDHPNIVKLLGTCRGFSPYASMILPWFANGSLPSFLQKHKSLIYSERLRFIREVAAGLAYLHSNAIIHGDLTGANVLISDDHSACLSDFGLSVLARDFDLPSMSRFTSGAGGSVRWTAPELYAFGDGDDGAPQPRLTLQTDVYAFGCVALEIFSGEVPFCNVQNEMEVLLKYVVPGVFPERPTKMGSKFVSDKHWSALEWCWARDPMARPSSKVLSSLFEEV